MRPTLLLAGLALALGIAAHEECADGGSPTPSPAYPQLAVGCWQLLERHGSKALAIETLRAYLDAGFYSFDTADIYGESEALLGQLLAVATHDAAPTPRFLTKFVTHDPTLTGARRVNAQSQRALGAVPELVQFHWWDYSESGYVEAARNLHTLQQEGQLRQIGACNFDVDHLRKLIDAGVPIVTNQVQYSLLDRRPENGMLAYARATGLKLACFGTVGGGWLSDEMLGLAAPPDRKVAARTISMRMYRAALERWSRGDWALFQELLRALRAVADAHGSSIANVAAAWVQFQIEREGAGGWLIVGVRDTKHLEEHKALRALALNEVDVAAIGRVLAKGVPPQGDIWSHERYG